MWALPSPRLHITIIAVGTSANIYRGIKIRCGCLNFRVLAMSGAASNASERLHFKDTNMEPAKDAARLSLGRIVSRREPVFTASWRINLRRVKKNRRQSKQKISQTSRPTAKRRSNLMHKSWHKSPKSLTSASWALREVGSVCWALPSMNSPKFMALDGFGQPPNPRVVV